MVWKVRSQRSVREEFMTLAANTNCRVGNPSPNVESCRNI